ncbi:hypothetical protein SLA2020_091130 [Shorea laevis]
MSPEMCYGKYNQKAWIRVKSKDCDYGGKAVGGGRKMLASSSFNFTGSCGISLIKSDGSFMLEIEIRRNMSVLF